ncbi:unnamed protein product [Amoebophrya sp. A120]|nr:unnamed protein product [Amoebophrya sp. A120]|eukprot:GSA120T00013530001.1
MSMMRGLLWKILFLVLSQQDEVLLGLLGRGGGGTRTTRTGVVVLGIHVFPRSGHAAPGGQSSLLQAQGEQVVAAVQHRPTFEQVLDRFPPGWKERFGQWCTPRKIPRYVGPGNVRSWLEKYLAVQYNSRGKEHQQEINGSSRGLRQLLNALQEPTLRLTTFLNEQPQDDRQPTYQMCSWLLRNALMADPVLGGYGDTPITSERLDLRAALFDVNHVPQDLHEGSAQRELAENLDNQLKTHLESEQGTASSHSAYNFHSFLPEFVFWADVDDTLVCSHSKTFSIPGTDQSLTRESEQTLSANEMEDHTHRVYPNFPLLLKFLNIESAMHALYLPGNDKRGQYTFADVDPRNVEVVRVKFEETHRHRVTVYSEEGKELVAPKIYYRSVPVPVYDVAKRLPWYPALLTARPGRLISQMPGTNSRRSASTHVALARRKVMVTRSHFPALAYHVRLPREPLEARTGERFGRGPLMILPGSDRAGALIGATFGETGIRKTNRAEYEAHNPQAACTLAGDRKFEVLSQALQILPELKETSRVFFGDDGQADYWVAEKGLNANLLSFAAIKRVWTLDKATGRKGFKNEKPLQPPTTRQIYWVAEGNLLGPNEAVPGGKTETSPGTSNYSTMTRANLAQVKRFFYFDIYAPVPKTIADTMYDPEYPRVDKNWDGVEDFQETLCLSETNILALCSPNLGTIDKGKLPSLLAQLLVSGWIPGAQKMQAATAHETTWTWTLREGPGPGTSADGREDEDLVLSGAAPASSSFFYQYKVTKRENVHNKQVYYTVTHPSKAKTFTGPPAVPTAGRATAAPADAPASSSSDLPPITGHRGPGGEEVGVPRGRQAAHDLPAAPRPTEEAPARAEYKFSTTAAVDALKDLRRQQATGASVLGSGAVMTSTGPTFSTSTSSAWHWAAYEVLGPERTTSSRDHQFLRGDSLIILTRPGSTNSDGFHLFVRKPEAVDPALNVNGNNKVQTTLRYRANVFAEFDIRPLGTKPGAAVVVQHAASTVLRRAPELEVVRGGSAYGSPFRSNPYESGLAVVPASAIGTTTSSGAPLVHPRQQVQELAWTVTAPHHFDGAQEVHFLQIQFLLKLAQKGTSSRRTAEGDDVITSSGTAEPGTTRHLGNQPLQDIVDRGQQDGRRWGRTTTPYRNHVNLELHRFVKDWRDLGRDGPLVNPMRDPKLQVCITSYVEAGAPRSTASTHGGNRAPDGAETGRGGF